jgi:hypothetical protein
VRLDGEDLVASYVYSDPDGDSELGTEIRWYKDSVLQPAFNDVLEVPAGSTTVGDVWYFTVRPQDSWGDFGDLQTCSNVTIRSNTAPTHDTPQLVSSAGTNRDDEDLIASAVNPFDSDGDEVTSIYHWFRDGTSITNLLMPFDTESYSEAEDYSGYGNDGVVTGASWTEDGVVGGAYVFDGNDGIMVAEQGTSLGGDGSWSAISVEFWVKATVNSGTERLLWLYNASSTSDVGFRLEFSASDINNYVRWRVHNATSSNTASHYITDGPRSWHHVVATYESGVGLKIFVDGLLRASAAGAGAIQAVGSGVLAIGYQSGSGDFMGVLDEVRIYRGALSSAQIFQRFIETKDGASSSSTMVAQEVGPLEAWKCEVIPNDSFIDGTAKNSSTIDVLVAPVNARPRIDTYSPTDLTPEVDEGAYLNFNHTSSDPDGEFLSISWLLDSVEVATSQNWTYAPLSGDIGMHNVTLVVTDYLGLFDSMQWNVTVADLYTLTVIVDGSGSVTVSPDQLLYSSGTSVNLTATADSGWVFSEWTGDLTGSGNPGTLVMDGDKTVTAVFTLTGYTLTINVVGSGAVNLNVTGPYNFGDVVELTAVPSLGWLFSSWSVDLSGGANPNVIVMDADKVVNATFVMEDYSLTVNVIGNGVVNLNASAPFYYGDFVELSAVPSLGWSFTGWSVDLSGSANPAVIFIDGNKVVNATFVQDVYTLTVNVEGNGLVNVNKTAPYYYGDFVELNATADLGWVFSSWSVDLTGSANPAVLVIDGNKVVNATFVQIEYTLTVTVDGSGLVTRNNTGPYYYGDWVHLTAVADLGWSFSQWSGDASGTSVEVDVFINGNKSVTAIFARIQYALIVSVSGDGSTNATGTFMHDAFSNVTVLATPSSGWVFDHWTLNSSNAGSINPYTINMTADFDLTAVFTQLENSYLVVRGTDSWIYYRLYNASSGSWEDWRVVPGGSTPDSPAAVLYSGKLYIAVHGSDGYNIWFSWINLSDYSFSGWTLVSGGTESAPTLVQYGSNLILVVRGTNNWIYYRLYDCVSDTWGQWMEVPSGSTPDTPAAAMLGDILHVVVRGDDNGIWHSYINMTSSEFSDWQLVGGSTTSRPALAASESSGELYLVVRGMDNWIYYNTWGGVVWSGWTALPSGATSEGPSAVVVNNELNVVVRGSDGPTLWSGCVDLDTSGFSGWSFVTGSTDSAPTLTRP